MSVGAELVAGDLIREIRRESGVTQAELARRSGLPRSVLSAYEHGRRQPAVAALARIAAATGLEVRVVAAAERTDTARAGAVLAQVLDLAELLPYRPRSNLAYPPLGRLAA
jgi:transcriptional regulator with XRE-family HTH domain